jgi:hypothetical protein
MRYVDRTDELLASWKEILEMEELEGNKQGMKVAKSMIESFTKEPSGYTDQHIQLEKIEFTEDEQTRS